MKTKSQRLFLKGLIKSYVIMLVIMAAITIIGAPSLFAQETHPAQTAELTPERADLMKFGFMAAALAFGLGAIGAGIAVGSVGSAAMGAISEKPELVSRAMIFVAMGEGLVILGFVIAIMILGSFG